MVQNDKIVRKPVLVTSGSDFLAWHLCEHLHAEDREFLCVDNWSGFRSDLRQRQPDACILLHRPSDRCGHEDDHVSGPNNIGNPVELPIGSLDQRIISMVGSRSRSVYRPLPQHDPIQRGPDTSRAHQILSWEPRSDPGEGLGPTIAYFVALLARTNQPVELTA
jgi:nucleoside-diphosphate-sugar epimerase